MIKLYGNPMSTCTRKVLTTLAEKNQQFEFVTVDLGKGEHKQPAHLARQPFGVVPAIDDDGFQMYESRAIIRYLDRKLPGNALTPSDLSAYARMEQWISIEHSNFSPPAMTLVMQLFFGKMRGAQPDMGAVDAARPKVEKAFDAADQWLANNDFFAGKTFSLADICWAPYMEYLVPAGLTEQINARKNLSRWWQAVSSRPSWQKAIGKGGA